jgi:hypothetical protein
MVVAVNNMNDNKDKIVLPPEELIRLEKIIDIGTLADNSVLLFRIKEINENVYAAIERIMDLFGKKLEDKKCSLLVLNGDSDISTLSEKQMLDVGWIRQKEKSLIIH